MLLLLLVAPSLPPLLIKKAVVSVHVCVYHRPYICHSGQSVILSRQECWIKCSSFDFSSFTLVNTDYLK